MVFLSFFFSLPWITTLDFSFIATFLISLYCFIWESKKMYGEKK